MPAGTTTWSVSTPCTFTYVNPHQIVWFNRSSQIPGTVLEPFFKEGDW